MTRETTEPRRRMSWPRLDDDQRDHISREVDRTAAHLAQRHAWGRWDPGTVLHLAILQGLADIRRRGIADLSPHDGRQVELPETPAEPELPPRRPELEGVSMDFDTGADARDEG